MEKAQVPESKRPSELRDFNTARERLAEMGLSPSDYMHLPYQEIMKKAGMGQ